MALVSSSNPVLSTSRFQEAAQSPSDSGVMTVKGTIDRTLIALLLTIGAAAFVWSEFAHGHDMMPFMLGGLIVGAIVGLVTTFWWSAAPYTTPVYAVCEGFFLGGISTFFEHSYPGIVMQAVALTFGVFFALLLAYRSRLIQATAKFRMAIVACTSAICLVYLTTMVLGLFRVHVPYIHEAGPIGVLFSLFVVGIAALNLILDFDFIERAASRGAPKALEWYGAFGLLVTLVWLYLEILRLLAKLQGSRGDRSRGVSS